MAQSLAQLQDALSVSLVAQTLCCFSFVDVRLDVVLRFLSG